jgi:peptidoglycan/LPS O-acetylase OafA/YrhL
MPMRLARRPAFAVPPRIALPVLLVIVAAMFLLFVSLDTNGVSVARIAATVVVSAAILVLFAVLALVSRASRGARRESTG